MYFSKIELVQMDRVASVSTLISKIFETRFLIGQDSRFARSPIYLDIMYFSEIELVQMDRVASVSRLIFKMVNVFVPVNGENQFSHQFGLWICQISHLSRHYVFF